MISSSLEALHLIEENTKEDPDSEEARNETLKSIENVLYQYVINGCEQSFTKGAFPELQEQYDPESYDMLEEKIRVLAEIAQAGSDCDYKNIEGFSDILENKQPEGIQTIAYY